MRKRKVVMSPLVFKRGRDDGRTHYVSKKTLTRPEVMQGAAAGQMRQREAAQAQGLSERKIKRLMRTFREAGAAGLLSKRRGPPSNNKFEAAFKERASGCLRPRYPDFGPTLAAK